MTKSRDAFNIVMRIIKRLPAERIATVQALGHVLAREIKAPRDLPPFNRSAMDGYAIAEGDEGNEFKVIGEVCAGQVYKSKLRPGCTVKIMTGAKLPAGAGKVIMKEHVEEIGASRIKIAIDDDRINLRLKGEAVGKGDKLYLAGELITPVVLANIASLGIGDVSVYRKPKAGILVTGSELLVPGSKYEAGKIYNSNGPMLRSMLAQQGIDVSMELSAKDTRSSLKSAFKKLLKRSDVIFISGGISVGDYDLVYETMHECGAKIHISRVAIQPGKPFTFATCENKPVFALPGNPVSVFVTYNLFALPALYKMMGMDFKRSKETRIFKGVFKRDRTERELYLPVIFDGNDGVRSVEYQGSGDLYALSKACGFMIVPIGRGEVKDGERVNTFKF
ncbi:MAG: molybdopterin molybdotransferase MoeA [Pseudomonadota bacterium]